MEKRKIKFFLRGMEVKNFIERSCGRGEAMKEMKLI